MKSAAYIICIKAMGLIFIGALLLTGCSKPVPDDGNNAKMVRFEGIYNYRYCEIFLIGGRPFPKDLAAAFYNTTDRNNGAVTRDSCSDEIWATVDVDELKEQYNVLGVFKNGPRFWVYDWLELPVGAEREFGDVRARWMGGVKLPKDFGKEGSTFYNTTAVTRHSKQGYNKGTKVYILDDPEGTTWIMQAYSRIIDPTLSYHDLDILDQKLALPAGWKYRTKVLDADLAIGAINGHARVTQDNLENTYNALFELDGQKNYTYKP